MSNNSQIGTFFMSRPWCAPFNIGDRVWHKGRNETGTVTATGSRVVVEFDNLTPRGHRSVGEFDEIWFNTHPDWLKLADDHQ